MTDFSPQQLEADNAQYAAFEKEMAESEPGLFDEAPSGETPAPRETPAADPELSDEQWEAEANAELDRLAVEGFDRPQRRAPRIEEDPLGYFQHRLSQLEGVAEQQHASTIMNHVRASEAQMRQKTADYDDAISFLEESRMSELKAMYPDRDPSALAVARQHGFASIRQLRAVILNEEKGHIIAQSVRSRKDPASFYYDLAKARGFQPNSRSNAVHTHRGSSARSSSAEKEMSRLADLYVTDPEAADAEFEKWAAKQR